MVAQIIVFGIMRGIGGYANVCDLVCASKDHRLRSIKPLVQ